MDSSPSLTPWHPVSSGLAETGTLKIVQQASREGKIREVAEQVPAVCDVLDTIERRRWERLAGLLHPEIHWTTAAEEDLHGRREVIARLLSDPPPAPPSFHEVRDGLIYRWIDCPG